MQRKPMSNPSPPLDAATLRAVIGRAADTAATILNLSQGFHASDGMREYARVRAEALLEFSQGLAKLLKEAEADGAPDRSQPMAGTTSNRSGPIALSEAQQQTVTEWAADDRLWTTQETVEINLRTFARKILALAAPVGEQETRFDQPVINLPALWERMAKLLDGVAVALNGPEPPLTRWSWHDLPEKAAAAKQAAAQMHARCVAVVEQLPASIQVSQVSEENLMHSRGPKPGQYVRREDVLTALRALAPKAAQTPEGS